MTGDQESCDVCERDPHGGHWCTVKGDFVGDATMGALEWEMAFGDQAPEGGDGE